LERQAIVREAAFGDRGSFVAQPVLDAVVVEL
jgi:hypothetical protein